ncbi:MAG: GIY-YIG nuclease family protein [Clostridia bacterium]|nr:GIY-YIG nuclease family protein [Clostridia bacterium]
MYYTYILRCCDDSLYTGIASDIDRRMGEHFGRGKMCARYTRSRKAKRLEAVWKSGTRSEASKLEYRIKQLDRDKKLILIGENTMQLFGDKINAENYERMDDPELFGRWNKE